MLKVDGISTFYGHIRALNHVSLDVNDGEIVTLIGANGAGKTTLLNTISGMLHPKNGDVVFDSKKISRMRAEQIVRL
ncbi:MAG: ATP-binding cassette domain-containing protein, partial [Chloroflexi bacterium]|nr:ATP-binding cassette domain-containing protein [Chloroflexota bacterium]